MLLEDGTGSGRSAKVTEENKLAVDATTLTEITHVNIDHGDAYTVFLESTPTYEDPSSETGELCVFYLKNLSDHNLIISQIGVWSESNRYIEPTVNPDGSPVDTLVLTPTNMNLASGNTASGDFYTGNSINGVSGGTRISRFRIPANNATNFSSLDSRIVIPKNNIFAIYVSEPDVAIEVTLNFYYHNGV